MNSDSFDEYGVCQTGCSIEKLTQLVTPSLSASAATALAFLVSSYPVSELVAVQDQCAQLVECAQHNILKLLPIMYIFSGFGEID